MQLPPEILMKIFSNLDVKSIVNCSAVNKMWYELTNLDIIWEKFCKDSKLLRKLKTEGISRSFKHPCYWKSCFIIHEKVLHNWRSNSHRKHEIELSGHCENYQMAAYDDQTLVICFLTNLHIFKVETGNFTHIQTLMVSSDMMKLLQFVKTNTSHIVLNCGKLIAVYSLTNDLYVGLCMFYKERNAEKLKFLGINDANMEKIANYFLRGHLCNINSVIQCGILYIYDEHIIYLWDLSKMICLKEIVASTFLIVREGENIYLCSDEVSISSYDNFAHILFTVTPKWRIRQIEVNKILLLAVESDSPSHVAQWVDNESRNICVWDKNSGVELYRTKVFMPDYYYLHPNLEILLQNVNCDNKIWALNPRNGEIVWERIVHYYSGYDFSNKNIVSRFRELGADRLIIVHGNSKQEYQIIDSFNGKLLYNLNEIEISFVGFDILLHTDHFKKNLVIRNYL